MLMYSNYKEEDMKKVSIASINFLYKQLRDLLMTYEKKILISSDEERDALNKLKFIVMMLEQGRYDQLITDPYYVIDFTDDKDDYLPDYYPL